MQGVNLFGARRTDYAEPSQTVNGELISRLDGALTQVFSEQGKQTVLYYMTNRFDLSLEQASRDPAKLERALTSMLGEIGWMVVKRAILEALWGRNIAMSDTKLVEKASLHDAFGFIRSMNLGTFVGPM